MNINNAIGHSDWTSRFKAVPQADQTQENEQMTEIISLLPTDAACDESKMAALINNEETTIFLGLDDSYESLILLHNLEIVPSSRLQKTPMIRALHGFGAQATVITMTYSKTMRLRSIKCPSLSNIRKFVGYEQLLHSTPRTTQCLLHTRALIALPPFISSKLMDLPDLSVDHVLSTVLKTLTDYDQVMQQPTKINLLQEVDDDTSPAQNTRTGEHVDDPITETSQDIDSDSDNETYRAAGRKDLATDTNISTMPPVTAATQDSTIPKKAKKPSCFPKCEVLLRYLWSIAYQLKCPSVEPQVPSLPIRLAVTPALLAWSKERHIRNTIGEHSTPNPIAGSQQPPGGTNATSNPEHDHLARKSTTALETISATFHDLALAKAASAPGSPATEKVHELHWRMIRRLCTIDARTDRPPTKFFTELSSAPGKGGTGAVLRWTLHMTFKHWNIRVTNGCISAIAKGLWCWDRAGYPNNMTIFSFPRVTANDYAKGLSDDTANLHLRANHGRDLSERDVKLLTHQGMSYTPDVGETIKQLKNFSKCLSAMIHDDSMLSVNLQGFIKMVEDHEETYESNQSMDSLFCLKLIYKVDLVRDRLFKECLIQDNFNDVDWNICDFYRIHSSVMDGTFQQLLPMNLGIPDSTAAPKRQKTTYPADTDQEEPNQKRAKRSQQSSTVRPKDSKGNQVHNSEQSPILKLKSDESYAELIMKQQQLKHLPKMTNSTNSICANFHVLGHCHTNCQRKESHKQLSSDVQRAAEDWMKKCRSDSRG
jgi:hypothetical protein